MATIRPDQLDSEIGKILQTFNHSIVTATDEASLALGKEAAKRLKETSPRGNTGRAKPYASTWKVKKMKNGTVYVHNDKNYRLTHLLEKGHVIRTASGKTVGKARAFPHIKPVEEMVIQEYPGYLDKYIGLQK